VLSGHADPSALASDAPTLERFDAKPITLPDVEWLQVLYELKSDVAEAMLPPGLHPTVPGLVTWLAWACEGSPWGAMRLVQTRIECRSGNRPRAMLVSGVCDNAAAIRALESGFGFRLAPGEIDLRRGYDGGDLRVRADGREILALELRDPVLLPPEVVQFVSGMHPACTPNGFRLVQCDMEHAVTRSERTTPRVRAFDAATWGDVRIEPRYPVSSALGLAEVVIPALRFVCKADELAFSGTEKVG
jgi:hypothetical protein